MSKRRGKSAGGDRRLPRTRTRGADKKPPASDELAGGAVPKVRTRRVSDATPAARKIKRGQAESKPVRAAKPKPVRAAKPKRVRPKAAKPKLIKAAKPRPVKAAKLESPRRQEEAAGGRVLSQTRAAVRARERRAERRGLEEQRAGNRVEGAKKAKATIRAKRRGVPVDERKIAIGWLREVRALIARVFKVSLDVTEPEAGSRTPWLVVGRFDAQQPIGYLELAQALMVVSEDYMLSARINPNRMSQIRVVYEDPKSRRGEGDSIVSKMGGWDFVLSDLIGEMLGAGPDDVDALAVRYSETRIQTFYVYFGSEIIRYVTVGPWKEQRTQNIKL